MENELILKLSPRQLRVIDTYKDIRHASNMNSISYSAVYQSIRTLTKCFVKNNGYSYYFIYKKDFDKLAEKQKLNGTYRVKNQIAEYNDTGALIQTADNINDMCFKSKNHADYDEIYRSVKANGLLCKNGYYYLYANTENNLAKVLKASYKGFVLQYDKNSNFIAEHENCLKASDTTGISYSSIYRCLKGHMNTAGGYKWKYKSEIIDDLL